MYILLAYFSIFLKSQTFATWSQREIFNKKVVKSFVHMTILQVRIILRLVKTRREKVKFPKSAKMITSNGQDLKIIKQII